MKYLSYGRQSINDADIRAVAQVLGGDLITQGPKVKEFEDALCEYTGAKYAVAVSSGTAALHIACLAADIKQGEEVITSPLTFAASANCILYSGAIPVFSDIEEETGNIQANEISAKINTRTSALIPVHFAGNPCDLDVISKIARKYKLTIIEDAAHALGAKYKGSKIGSCKHSDMTIFSFHPVKHITTGEGGAVLTNQKKLYERLLLFRNHGITKDPGRIKSNVGPWYYEMQELGFNYRITDFQCALGSSQLKRIAGFLKRRKEIVNIYDKELADIKEISLPVVKTHVRSCWHLYPIRVKNGQLSNRKDVFTHLRGKGIGVQVHYIPVYFHPYYQKLGFKKGICPRAEEFYASEISLPIHPSLSDKEVLFVVNVLKSYFNKRKA